MDVDYTAYLQGSLVLDEEGNWWHEKVRFQNPKLSLFFHKAIRYSEEDANFYVVVGRQRALFSYTDTALFVTEYLPEQNSFTLNNEQMISVLDASFESRSADSILYLSFIFAGHALKARFTRNCYQAIASYVTGPRELCFGGQTKSVHCIEA